MAKYKTIGSVLKAKDFEQSKRTYVKIKEDVSLKAGSFIDVVNPRTLAEQLEGKVSEEVLQKIREQGERTPDFVLFELRIKNEE